MKIKELHGETRRVDVEGIITSIGEVRNVNLRTGGTANVATASLSDDTGVVALSLWNEDIERVEVGKRVKITGGYTTTFRGQLQLNLGRWGEMEVA